MCISGTRVLQLVFVYVLGVHKEKITFHLGFKFYILMP